MHNTFSLCASEIGDDGCGCVCGIDGNSQIQIKWFLYSMELFLCRLLFDKSSKHTYIYTHLLECVHPICGGVEFDENEALSLSSSTSCFMSLQCPFDFTLANLSEKIQLPINISQAKSSYSSLKRSLKEEAELKAISCLWISRVPKIVFVRNWWNTISTSLSHSVGGCVCVCSFCFAIPNGT